MRKYLKNHKKSHQAPPNPLTLRYLAPTYAKDIAKGFVLFLWDQATSAIFGEGDCQSTASLLGEKFFDQFGESNVDDQAGDALKKTPVLKCDDLKKNDLFYWGSDA